MMSPNSTDLDMKRQSIPKQPHPLFMIIPYEMTRPQRRARIVVSVFNHVHVHVHEVDFDISLQRHFAERSVIQCQLTRFTLASEEGEAVPPFPSESSTIIPRRSHLAEP